MQISKIHKYTNYFYKMAQHAEVETKSPEAKAAEKYLAESNNPYFAYIQENEPEVFQKIYDWWGVKKKQIDITINATFNKAWTFSIPQGNVPVEIKNSIIGYLKTLDIPLLKGTSIITIPVTWTINFSQPQ